MNYGKGGEVTVSLRDNTPGTQLMIAPGGPTVQASLSLPAAAHDIAAGEGVAVIAAGMAGVLFVDLAKLQIAASYQDKHEYTHVAMQGDRVLAADNSGRLALIDIHDPRQPRLLASLDTGSVITALSWHGARAYVLHGDNTLQCVTLSKASQLRITSSLHLDGTARALADDGRHVFVAGGDQGLLLLDADNGKVIGRYRSTGPAQDVALEQGLAFIAQGEGCVGVGRQQAGRTQLDRQPQQARRRASNLSAERSRLAVQPGRSGHHARYRSA